MLAFQEQFLGLLFSSQALKFGSFVLKSGRVSPYFFDLGTLCTGEQMEKLGQCYAQAIRHYQIDCNVLFGPAYKGIPIAVATAIALRQAYQCDMSVAYNRKEAKDHGEGGSLVGQVEQQRVLIVDDIITAGTAATIAVSQLRSSKAKVAGLMVALDRQEVSGGGNISATQALSEEKDLKVFSLVGLDQVISFLSQQGNSSHLDNLLQYRASYGA